jgi:hypothetical protein
MICSRNRPHRAGDGPRPVRAGSGLALSSDRSVRRGLRDQARLRVYVHQAPSICGRCPAGTVALEAGGAGTYTKRAIPGPEPSWDAGGSPRFMQPVAAGSRVAVCLLRIRSGW